jgi:hypothetical protein
VADCAFPSSPWKENSENKALNDAVCSPQSQAETRFAKQPNSSQSRPTKSKSRAAWHRAAEAEQILQVSVAGHLLGEIADQRQLKLLVLKRLVHHENPQHEDQQADKRVESKRQKAKVRETQQPEDKRDTEINYKNRDRHDDRLRCMKPYKRPLIDQEKDQSGDPSQDVAK